MQTYDETRPCPKCQGVAMTHYDRGRDVMDRRCLRCGYEWMEAPLDHKARHPEATDARDR